MKKKPFAPALAVLGVLFFLWCVFLLLFLVHRARAGQQLFIQSIQARDPEAAGEYMRSFFEYEPAGDPEPPPDLALAERTVSLFSGAVLPPALLALLLFATALFPLGAGLVLFLARRDRERCQKDLRDRVRLALNGGAFVPAPGEELIALVLEENRRVREVSGRREEELRLYVENVAHEIKNPAAGVLLNLDLIESLGPTADRLGHARESLERIQGYTTSLLTLSRLRHDLVRLEKERLDLGDVLRDAAAALPEAGPEVHLEEAEDCPVFGDRARLFEAFYNLISNARRHCIPGGRVSVRLEKSDRELTVTVLNPAEKAPDPASMERYAVGAEDGTSTGIGLSLAREIISRHFGTLELTSPAAGYVEARAVFPIFSLKSRSV